MQEIHNRWRMTDRERGTSETYALGYSQRELERLQFQAAFVRDLTEDVLRRAGLAPGMRVLDLGCGVGDVSLMAGEMVGPTGAVLGIDRSTEAIATAERRATEAGQCYWVRFATAELDRYLPDEEFDAIIGRFILMYMPDPATFLWLATYLAAGLPAPRMIAAARVEGGPDSPVYLYMTETVRNLLPVIERLGVATPDQVEIDGLAERLRNEAVANSACMMLPPLVGAWTRMRSNDDRPCPQRIAGARP